MKCQNCGENDANFRYTQIINGNKKEIALCDECSKKLGLQTLDLNIPINFSSFFGDFLEGSDSIISSFVPKEELKCDKCGMTYNEFVKKGKFGCSNCYTVFENKIENILKNVHGSNIHTGKKYILKNKDYKKNSVEDDKISNVKNNEDEINRLEKELRVAVSEERYEDAANIRDKIKKYREEKNV